MDINALIEALKNKLQVTLTYTKTTTGEAVVHTGGIYEINTGAGLLWLWDTSLNDTIRKFYLNNISSFQVLDIPFMPPNPWPIKLDGMELGF